MARRSITTHNSFAHPPQTVTHTLYNLATHPEYVQPLREEIESVIQEHGWRKASVTKMTKLDSFVKETMRLSPVAACTYSILYLHIYSKNNFAASMRRKAMKDFTFADGTIIPAGNIVTIAASCMQTDPVKISRHYPHLDSQMYIHTGQLHRCRNFRWFPLCKDE